MKSTTLTGYVKKCTQASTKNREIARVSKAGVCHLSNVVFNSVNNNSPTKLKEFMLRIFSRLAI